MLFWRPLIQNALCYALPCIGFCIRSHARKKQYPRYILSKDSGYIPGVNRGIIIAFIFIFIAPQYLRRCSLVLHQAARAVVISASCRNALLGCQRQDCKLQLIKPEEQVVHAIYLGRALLNTVLATTGIRKRHNNGKESPPASSKSIFYDAVISYKVSSGLYCIRRLFLASPGQIMDKWSRHKHSHTCEAEPDGTNQSSA